LRLGLLLTAALLVAVITLTQPAAANHSVLRLASVDPPGSTLPLGVLGPNMSSIVPDIELTPDGSTAVYRTNMALTKSSDGRAELVGLGPRGLADGSTCRGEHVDCHHMVSRDGKRVVFETPSPLVDSDADSCGGPGTCVDVYQRTGSSTTLLSFQDQDGGSAPFDSFLLESMSLDGTRVFIRRMTRTIFRMPVGTWEHVNSTLVPFPSPGNQASWPAIHREGASTDGRRVFFTTADSLVPEDMDSCVTGTNRPPQGCSDVYERTREGAVRLVSTGLGLANEPFDAHFDGASEDGRRVYFTTREKLVPEDTDQCFNGAGNPWGCTDVYERSSGVTRLISVGPAGGAAAVEAEFGAVSADGTRVFFLTDEPLVPEDTDACPDYRGPGCVDIYELRGEVLGLVSTGPTGNRDGFDDRLRLAGISKDGSHVFFETWEPLVTTDTDNQFDVYEHTSGVTRLLSSGPNSPNGDFSAFFNGSSEDGKRVFFTTREPLLPEDHDCTVGRYPGDVGCPDIYERQGGVTSLITRSTVECVNTDFGFEPLCPAFVGASKDGRRVFFVTQESLVPEDTDALNDLYVAIAPSRACRAGKPGKRPKKCGF
jgi:hypothetical protein